MAMEDEVCLATSTPVRWTSDGRSGSARLIAFCTLTIARSGFVPLANVKVQEYPPRLSQVEV